MSTEIASIEIGEEEERREKKKEGGGGKRGEKKRGLLCHSNRTTLSCPNLGHFWGGCASYQCLKTGQLVDWSEEKREQGRKSGRKEVGRKKGKRKGRERKASARCNRLRVGIHLPYLRRGAADLAYRFGTIHSNIESKKKGERRKGKERRGGERGGKGECQYPRINKTSLSTSKLTVSPDLL